MCGLRDNYVSSDSQHLVRQKRDSRAGPMLHDLRIPIDCAEGFAVDWVGRNIYWTDAVKHVIEMATADGRYRRTLITQLKGSPKSLVLDPAQG